MKTIKCGLSEGLARLEAVGVPDFRVDVEWLLEHVTGIRRLELPLNFSREFSDSEWALFCELIDRREKREPLQHILGKVNFLGHDIQVSNAALIPRPETERLAELAIERLQERGVDESLRVLDFGTGTGCLAIAIAKGHPNAAVTALDVSRAALNLARENTVLNKVDERVSTLESDGFSSLGAAHQFGLIVSNPPYIPRAEINSLQQEVREFDPVQALDGGEDGLVFYRNLASEGKRYLEKGGGLLFEFGDGQEASIQSIFAESGWRRGICHHDYCDRSRFLEFWVEDR